MSGIADQVNSLRNLRTGNDDPIPGLAAALVTLVPEAAPAPTSGAPLVTELEDGSVEIDFDVTDAPAEMDERAFAHDANLAEFLGETELNTVGADLIDAINSDIDARTGWEETYEKGLALLGLTFEDGTQISGTTLSNIKHPLLLEALMHYFANATGELLPAEGPVKVYDTAVVPEPGRSELAEALEKDMNYYLTSVAEEYYPDFERMLVEQGLCGNGFRKVFRCPLRRRPVSDSVSATDLIISPEAKSIGSALRVTHRFTATRAVIKRMQRVGAWIKVDLGSPAADTPDTEIAKREIDGVDSEPSGRPEDDVFTFYECHTDLDLLGFEDCDDDGEKTGLPLPYVVTIEADSQRVVAIRRDWKEGDADFKRRKWFVKYGMLPSLGVYDYGFVHILGNVARALSAAQSELIDAGMFANFPGFLIARGAARQETTDLRVSPGSGATIDTGGRPIADVVYPLPYKDPSATMLALVDKMGENGRRLGGMLEMPVGEGVANVPVGTIMALIEQASKVGGAIHKRNHRSQAEEFKLLKDLFAEDPTALVRFAETPHYPWSVAAEFSDKRLIPAADPNVPSHTHRLMQGTALLQLAASAPGLYDQRKVHERALRILRVPMPEELMNPPQPPNAAPQPDPTKALELATEERMLAKKHADAMQEKALEGELRLREQAMESADRAADRESREKLVAAKLSVEHAREVLHSASKNNTVPPGINPTGGGYG